MKDNDLKCMTARRLVPGDRLASEYYFSSFDAAVKWLRDPQYGASKFMIADCLVIAVRPGKLPNGFDMILLTGDGRIRNYADVRSMHIFLAYDDHPDE